MGSDVIWAPRSAAQRQTMAHTIYEDIRRYVLSRPAGEPLASSRNLADQYGVGIARVRRALNRLVDDGLLKAVDRQGYFVAEPQVPAPATAATIVYVSCRQAERMPYMERVLEAVVDGAAQAEANLIVRPSSYERIAEEAAQAHVTGLIVPWLAERMLPAIERNPRLHVVCQSVGPFVDEHPRIGFVGIDYRLIAMRGVKLLHDAGATNVICVARVTEFVDGARQTADRLGGRVEHLASAPEAVQDVMAYPVDAVVDELLAKQPSGVLFDDDYVATNVLAQLAEREPQYRGQLSAVSLANHRVQSLPDDVARLEVDGYDVGVAALAMLDAALQPPRLSMPRILCPARVVVPADFSQNEGHHA